MIFELMLGDLFVESNLMQKCFWLLWEAHERINSSQYIPYNFMQKVEYTLSLLEKHKRRKAEKILSVVGYHLWKQQGYKLKSYWEKKWIM